MAVTTGQDIHDLVTRLYPICRSITGDGVRTTLRILREIVPLELREIASGTPIFDWVVPKEWNVRSAYIAKPDGERVVDFADHNLHLMSYSVPVNGRFSRDEVLAHVHTLPEHPTWIPYRTSYYREAWAFCTRHVDLARFDAAEYDVLVDSTLTDGSLTYGELFLPGKLRDEVLFFSHVCHPSLANDNLSGIAVTAHLARALMNAEREFSYRFVWAPGTIGSIAWLATRPEVLPNVRHGLVAVLLGDSGVFQYKGTRFGNAPIDRICRRVIARRGGIDLPFEPYGYDERQFASPGVALPVGRLTRSPNGMFPEYHTSADDLTLVQPDKLAEALDVLTEIVDAIEHDERYVNLSPNCEPQLGKRGLYRSTGGTELPERQLALLWLLNRCDGEHSLLDIADESGIDLAVVRSAANELVAAELLARAR